MSIRSDIDAGPSEHNTALSTDEVQKLETLSKNVVDVLNMHAQDSGMPWFSDIARKHTFRDEAVYDPRPPRRSYVDLAHETSWSGLDSGSARKEGRDRAEQQSSAPATATSGWESWGAAGGAGESSHSPVKEERSPPASRPQSPRTRSPSPSTMSRRSRAFEQVEAASRDIPASNATSWKSGSHRQVSTSTSSNATALGSKLPITNGWGSAPSEPVSEAAPASTNGASEDDGWASYTPQKTMNDAYERRMAMSRSGGSINGTQTRSTAQSYRAPSPTPQPAVSMQSPVQTSADTAAPSTAADDGWGSWLASSTTNDAYERRARLNGDHPIHSQSTTTANGREDNSNSHALPATAPQSNGWGNVNGTHASHDTQEALPAASVADHKQPVAQDDGWGSWSASMQHNDAFEKRARLGSVQPEPFIRQTEPQPVYQASTAPTHAADSPSKAEESGTRENKPQEEDGWGSWQATTQVNDAYERRSRLREGEPLPPASPARSTHQRTASTVSHGWSGTSGHVPQQNGRSNGQTDSPYASTPYATADLLSRLNISSPAPSLAPSSRQTVLPELDRRKKGISIKGNFQRLMEETTRREATGEHTVELQKLKKRVQDVEAVSARSGRSSVAPSEFGRASSPALSMVSTRTVHAPQPVRPSQISDSWTDAGGDVSMGSVSSIREPEGPASEGSMLGRNFANSRRQPEVEPVRSETP